MPISREKEEHMDKPDNSTEKCPQCGSEMRPDDDHTNKVRVFVCTKPTCLYRMYPDYPRRNGNQEICYLCGKMFTARLNDLGVLCPVCKRTVQQCKRKASSKYRNSRKPRQSENTLRVWLRFAFNNQTLRQSRHQAQQIPISDPLSFGLRSQTMACFRFLKLKSLYCK